jgi:serpin B
MTNKLQKTILVFVLSALVIAGCGPAAVEPSPTPSVEPSPVPTEASGNEAVAILGPVGARDAALAYLAQSAGAQAVPAGLEWTEKDITAGGLVGASTFQYTSGEWVITVSYPIVLPENTIYHVVVTNESTGFRWEGDVDAEGQVTESTGAEGQVRPTPGVSDADLTELASGNSAFAFDLYQLLRGEKGNLFYSPYSISLALAMTYAGARGDTEKEMAQALHFLLPQDRLHPAFSRLAAELASRGEGAQGTDGKGFRLNVANALWGQEGYQFLLEFLNVLETYYGAGLKTVDFAGDPEAARQTINDWVSQETENRIQDLIPPGVIDTLTRLVLANAIYFNAAWLYPFEPDVTADGPFYLLDGSQVQVPMMRQSESFAYAQGEGYQAVELPYDGQQLSMVILLPAQGQLDAFEGTLDADRVETILKGLSRQQVDLTLPKFGFESQFSLKDALSTLGMPDAFTDAADFSGMTGNRELSISEVIHKAFVSVDEAGTEAAAATAVIVGLTSAPAQPVSFTADRPFLFLIRDIPTGTILFLGRVVDPTA